MRRLPRLAWLALVSLAASAALAERARVDLSGPWQFRADPERAGVTRRWFSGAVDFPSTVRVPGCWEAEGIGRETADARHSFMGWGWYERELAVPAGWRGQRLFLHVGGAHRTAEVWVNGRAIGHHLGYVTAFAFDVTEAVRCGEPNRVTILVDSEQHVETDGLAGCIDTYDFIKWGGLYGRVWLEARGEAWLENPFVRSEGGGARARVTAEVRGPQAAEGLTVRCRLQPVGGGRAYEATAPVGPGTSVELAVPTPGARLWSPEHPQLYLATVELRRGERTVDEVSVRCGLREIEIRENDLYLNGRRILLRGYGDDCCFPLTVCPPADKRFYLERFRVARDYGFIYVRHHSHVPLQEYFDAADEAGILVQPELPIAYENHLRDATPAAKDLFRSQWRDLILQYRNHPSVLTWCMGNEMSSVNALAPDLYRVAKELDGTRPVVDSDGLFGGPLDPAWSRPTLDLEHFQFNEATIPWGPNLGKYELPGAPTKPVTIHEMGNFVAFYDPREAVRYTGLVKPSWLVGAPATEPFDYASHREPHARMWYVRQLGEPWRVSWETDPVPATAGDRVAFVFTAATGFSSEPSGQFTLSLGDQPLLRFNCPDEPRQQWSSGDGRAELTFEVKQGGIDQFGVMCLVLPADRLTRGRPAVLTVTGSDSASRRWFAVYDYHDTIRYETAHGGLPESAQGATVVNGFARLVAWVNAEDSSVAAIAANRGTTALLPTFVENSRKLQALCHKLNLEAARCSREIDGYALWLLQDYWKGGQGLLTQFYQPKGLSAEAARQCNGPTVVLLRRSRCAVTAGEPVGGMAVVSHFGEDSLDRPRLSAELVDVTAAARVLARRAHSLDPIPQGTVRDLVEVQFPAPAVSAPAKLRLRLTLTDRDRSWDNQWDFWVFPDRPLPPTEGLIVTDTLTPDVLSRLRAGGRVLLTSRTAFAGDPLRFKSPWWFPGPDDSDLGTIIRRHPALGDFPHEGWCDLSWFEMIEGSVAVHHREALARVEPIIQAIDLPLRQATRSLLFETQVGEGKLLSVSLNLSPEVVHASPAARCLLGNLIGYARSDRFRPTARLAPEELSACLAKP